MLRILLLNIFLMACFVSASQQQKGDFYEKAIDELWQLVFSDPDAAIDRGKELIEGAKADRRDELAAKLSSRVGVAYDLKGEPEQALPYFMQAIAIQKRINDSSELSFSYNNLGLMYYAQYNYTPALKYLRLSLEIDRKQDNKEGMAGSLINTGIVLTYLDSMATSLELYNEALDLYRELNDSTGIMSCYSNIGKVYYHEKKYDAALKNYLIVQQYYESKKGTEETLSSSYNSLANTYSKMGNYQLALDYAFKDLAICFKANLRQRRQFAYETINEIYAAQGEYKKAHEYLRRYTDLRDSLLNESRASILEEMQTKYEVAEKNNELSTLKLEKQTETERKNRYRLYMYIAIAVFILVLAVVGYFLYSKQKINRLLQERNALNAIVIEQKEMMVGEIHHRVKNNLQLISSIIDLQTLHDENVSPEALNDLQKRVNSIALLHEFLYQGESLDRVRIDEYLKNLIDRLVLSFQQPEKTITVQYQIEPFYTDSSTAVPIGLIANELITNTFKYAFSGRDSGVIVIRLTHQQDALQLTFSDDGVGLSTDEQTTSFGTRIVRSLSRQLKAEWDIESNKGVTHIFTIKRFKVYEHA